MAFRSALFKKGYLTGGDFVKADEISKINNDGTVIFVSGKVARLSTDERFKVGDKVIYIIDDQGRFNVLAGQKH